MCACLSHAPHWGLGPQPRHMPQLGMEPVTPLLHSPVLKPLSHTSQSRWGCRVGKDIPIMKSSVCKDVDACNSMDHPGSSSSVWQENMNGIFHRCVWDFRQEPDN